MFNNQVTKYLFIYFTTNVKPLAPTKKLLSLVFESYKQWQKTSYIENIVLATNIY